MDMEMKNDLNESFREYVGLVICCLVETYGLSEEKAVEAVDRSFLSEVISDDPLMIMMTLHDSINTTAEDVYEEYIVNMG